MEPHVIAARARRIREAVAAASTELTSEDHAVTVVVGPGGAVRDLHLTSGAARYTGPELGALVVRTIREANALLRRDLAETLAEITGRPTDPFAPLPTPAQLRAELDRDGGTSRRPAGHRTFRTRTRCWRSSTASAHATRPWWSATNGSRSRPAGRPVRVTPPTGAFGWRSTRTARELKVASRTETHSVRRGTRVPTRVTGCTVTVEAKQR